MKLMFSVFGSLIILLSGSKNFLVLADYHLNRDFYEQLCVNKDKPAMQCHGKCQMQKKSQNENSSVNFERYNVNFCQNLIQKVDIGFQTKNFTEKSKINIFEVFYLPQISYSVPNPPPVL